MASFQNLSIRGKISSLVAAPIIGFVIFGAIFFQHHREQHLKAEETYLNSNVHEAASELIHQIQIERGRSALFVLGGVKPEVLKEQRALVDELKLKLKGAVESSSLDSSFHQDVAQIFSEIQSVRQDVDKSAPQSSFMPRMNSIVRDLIRLEANVARSSQIEGIEGKLLAPTLLEAAKESSGRLRATLSSIFSENKPLTAEQLAAIQSLKASIDANVNSPSLRLSPAGQKQIDELPKTKHWQFVMAAFDKAVANASTGQYEVDPKELFTNATLIVEDIKNVIMEELTPVRSQMFEIEEQTKKTMWTVASIILLSLLAILAMTFAVVRAILNPIDRVISDLSSSAERVHGTSAALENASQKVSSATLQSAAGIEETVASLEYVSGIVQQTAESAKKADSISQSGRQYAQEGEVEIQKLISATSEIANSSKRIEEIVALIDDIAFQTNLLALNASVEAARAGEQGKGFAVVAEAVRSLAQRCAVAAKDITTLVHEGAVKAQTGAQIAESSGKVFNKIVSSMNEASQLLHDIAQSSQEQTMSLQQINSSMNQLDEATQSNATSAQDAASSAVGLSDQAKDLMLTISELKKLSEGQKNSSGAEKRVSAAHTYKAAA